MNVAVLSNGVEREVALDLDPDQESVAALVAADHRCGGRRSNGAPRRRPLRRRAHPNLERRAAPGGAPPAVRRPTRRTWDGSVPARNRRAVAPAGSSSWSSRPRHGVGTARDPGTRPPPRGRWRAISGPPSATVPSSHRRGLGVWSCPVIPPPPDSRPRRCFRQEWNRGCWRSPDRSAGILFTAGIEGRNGNHRHSQLAAGRHEGLGLKPAERLVYPRHHDGLFAVHLLLPSSPHVSPSSLVRSVVQMR